MAQVIHSRRSAAMLRERSRTHHLAERRTEVNAPEINRNTGRKAIERNADDGRNRPCLRWPIRVPAQPFLTNLASAQNAQRRAGSKSISEATRSEMND
jgi:hypothetical protein